MYDCTFTIMPLYSFSFYKTEERRKKMNLYKTNWQNAVSVIGGSTTTHDAVVDEHDVVL